MHTEFLKTAKICLKIQRNFILKLKSS